MPGVVQVVVLEFKGASSSSKPSAKSLKVSMGKTQHQVWDRGEFSFPITKLRENLVIALMDASGNEIGHADIRTLEIIEKGYWDEVFSINGSGHAHMKLQFVLSEDEKNRIRVMRESVLKKKPVPNVSNNSRLVDKTVLASSLPKSMNNEQKDFQKKKPLKDTLHQLPDVSGIHHLQTDLPQGLGAPAEKIPKQQQHVKAETAPRDSQSNSESTSEKAVAYLEKKDVSKQKSPSKVRKIVSAFEDTRSQGAVRSKSIKPSLVSSQSLKQEPNAFVIARTENTDREQESRTPTSPQLEKLDASGISLTESAQKQEEKNMDSSSISPQFMKGEPKSYEVACNESAQEQEAKNLKHFSVSPHINIEESAASEVDSCRGAQEQEEESSKPSSNLPTFTEEQISLYESDKKEQQEENVKPSNLSEFTEERISLNESGQKEQEEESRQSTGMTTKLSSEETIVRQHQFSEEHKLSPGTLHYGSSASRDGAEEVSSSEKPVSLKSYMDEQSPTQRSGMWMFPDNARPLCITATDTHAVKTVKHYTQSSDHSKNSSSQAHILHKEEEHGGDKKMETASRKTEDAANAASGSSEDRFNGILRQVIKIAVILGFGVLIILTREKEPRKRTKEKDNIFGTSDDRDY